MRQLTAGMWKKAIVGASALIIVMGLVLVGLNSSVIPERVGRSAVDAFARATGWDMEVGRVEFVGPTRVVLRDVKASVPSEDVAQGWMSSVQAPSVRVGINPLGFIFGNREAPVKNMTWVSPEIQLTVPLTQALSLPVSTDPRQPDSSMGTGRVSSHPVDKPESPTVQLNIADGKLIDPQGVWLLQAEVEVGSASLNDVTIERLELAHVDNGTQLAVTTRNESTGVREWRWQATGPASLISGLLSDTGFDFSGAMQASGSYHAGTSDGMDFELSVRAGDIRWGEGDIDQSLAFDELYLSGRYDKRLAIDELKLVRPDGVLEGNGYVDLARAPFPYSPLELDVRTEQLQISQSLPILFQYGLSGPAEFNGVLTGSLAHPELSGKLEITRGTVWHRPVDQAEGIIYLDGDRFSFGQTVLEKGEGTYHLSGEWRKDRETPHLQITLESERGRAEEVLAALGQDEIDIRGEFDGHLTLRGPTGDLHVSGSIRGQDFHLYGQSLDRLDGEFSWNAQNLHLNDVVAHWRGGQVQLSGNSYRDVLDFQVAMDRWPLDWPMLPNDSSPQEQVSGWVSYTGDVMGTLDEPRTQGTVLDGEIRIGEWTLNSPAGGLAIDEQQVTFHQLRVLAFGHGEYVLDGTLEGWQEEDPRFNVQAEVRDASLSALFNENGLTLPALLVDGIVDGTIVLGGSASSPDARFDLALKDDLDIGQPLRLRFQVADGRIKFDGLSALLGVMSGWSSARNIVP